MSGGKAVRSLAVAGLALPAVLVPGAAPRAQIVPATPYFAMPPASTAAPVTQQVLENYRIQLLQTQRDMLQQNPSGLGRDQIWVGRQLNALNPVFPATSPGGAPPPSPGFNPAPFSPSGFVAAPFNAASPRP